MRRDSLSDLRVFIAVAREQSFTTAAPYSRRLSTPKQNGSG